MAEQLNGWEVDLAHLQAVMNRPAAEREKEFHEIVAKHPQQVTAGQVIALNAELHDEYTYVLLRHKQRLVGLEKKIDELTSQIALLKARASDLEKRPELRYCGPYQPGERYGEASLCTHQGGLWLAELATDRRPGEAKCGWKLIVKRGAV